MVLVRILLVAADEQVCLTEHGWKQIRRALIRVRRQRFFRLRVIASRDTRLLPVSLTRDAIEPHVMRLKEGPELVILLLGKRIVLVIMTARALQGDAEKCSRDRFDGVLQ